MATTVPVERAEVTSWLEANQRHLATAVAAVRVALERHAARSTGASADFPDPPTPFPVSPQLPPSALDQLCAAFGLSRFERDILLFCAAMELDGTIARTCATAAGDPTRAYPTFALALAAFGEPHWSALSPDAPLRRWRLIEVGPGTALTLSPLRIDEAILNYLAGVPHLDARLVGLLAPLPLGVPIAPSHRVVAERLLDTWSAGGATVLAQLVGTEPGAIRAIVAAASARIGVPAYLLPAELLPTAQGDLHALVELWAREARLRGGILLLDCAEVDLAEAARRGTIARFIGSRGGPLVVAGRDRLPLPQERLLTLEVGRPGRGEQRDLWAAALGAAAEPALIEPLVAQFSLGATAIVNASLDARGQSDLAETFGTRLWDACRLQARPRLDDLAQRIDSTAGWDDLILPPLQRRTLREIVGHLRQRATVYEEWGFAGRGGRGLGISALFAGGSGTGKTMAAEVLARELRLDLYRIDLSSVVSKYIGETEKNLRRVFDAAEEGGAILLFDEADALFGKRSEVKDSHDRYANIEVSYLLQRMEAYRGLAVLTTNLKSAIDTAFLRRLRFVITFPFPDPIQRAEIWRRVFPAATPTHDLDPVRLAQLNVAGGNIRNIALNAAFLAADAGDPVTMRHLLEAARSEYHKLEKSLTGVELAAFGAN